MLKKRKVPYISQLGNMDCGSACLAMIFNYYGLKIDIVDVGSQVFIGRDGMSLSVMKKIAEKFGFMFRAYQYGYDEKNLEQLLPAVLYSGSHYVIVENKNKENKYKIIDPANGYSFSSFSEIKNKYSDIIISITPTEKIQKNCHGKIELKVSKKRLLVIALLMILIQLITLIVPVTIQRVVDGLYSGLHIDFSTILITTVIIAISFFLLSWLRQSLLLNMDTEIFRKLISQMLDKLFKIDLSFFEWHSAGDIGNRFNTINQLNEVITNGMVNVLIQSITSVVCLIIMFRMSLKLSTYAFVLAIVQIALLSYINKSNMTKTTEYIRAQSVLQGDLVETLSNMIEIKCMGMDAPVMSNIRQKYLNQIQCFRNKTLISNLMSCFISTFSLIFPLTLYLIGGIFVAENELTIGTLIAYVTMAGYFTAPFTTIVMMLPNINSIKEVALRYKELVNYHENIKSSRKIEGKFETIRVQNISYAYGNGDSSTIDNISLEIKRGQSIALVGTSGSGKTTLVKAILGAIKVSKGEIFINKINVREIDRNQIYRMFSIVTQNPMCLNNTIRKNVDIVGQFTDKEIWKALEMAEIKKDIESMPLGLDTVLGERGQNISGGQRQRIAIARALIADTEVVIFDEATSNLDPITEGKIYENLKKCGKTQIVITHRLPSIQNADMIYVLNKGKIIEYGTHFELLGLRGWYHDSFINCENTV